MKKLTKKATAWLLASLFLVTLNHNPVQAFDSLQSYTNQPLTFTLRARDEISGIRIMENPDGSQFYFGVYTQGEAEVHLDYQVHGNGIYTFTAYDVATNTASVTKEIGNIDRKAPTITTNGNISDWVNVDVVINLEFEDAESGIKRIVYPDGSEETFADGHTDIIQRTYTIKQNGDYTFLTEDVAGNTTQLTEYITFIDKTVPTENIVIIQE